MRKHVAEFEPADVDLFVPKDDVADPQLSIVIPALNEELTIGRFVDWCRQGLREANVRGEIIIVDSSSDRTAEIALSRGARVLKTPKRGLGRAYIDALPFIRGEYVLMGDADCTYDFRELRSFMERFRSGYEYVMGSRFQGYIEPGSMPPLHQYLGTPVTTWILNFLYGSRFSDIHCGMRGITLDALRRMDLQSQSWEYASEMVLKSVRMELRTAEVPVRFLRDEQGRLSHHKRSGWFSPWQAAWINLKAMFVHGADFFLFRPGLLLLFVGLLLTVPVSLGPATVGPITFSLHWMLLGLVLCVLGLVVLRLFRRNDTALAKDVLLYAIGCAERRRCCRRHRFRNSIGCPLHPLRFPIVRNFSRRSSRRCWIVIGDRRIYEFHFYLGNPCGRREP